MPVITSITAVVFIQALGLYINRSAPLSALQESLNLFSYTLYIQHTVLHFFAHTNGALSRARAYHIENPETIFQIWECICIRSMNKDVHLIP